MKQLFAIIILCFLFNCERKVTTLNKKVDIGVENIKQNLSFDFSVIERDKDNRPLKVEIDIKNNDQVIQKINYTPGFWLDKDFKINQKKYFGTNLSLEEGIENYHNFIIADFNFDGLEDFAILYDSGGNGGSFYSYYFQNEIGKFNLDKNFPLNEGYFPKEINKNNKTITISNPIGCCKMETTIFQLKNNWKMISSKEENMNNDSPNGIWKTNCGSGLGSLTIKNKNASLVVLFNQIYIDMEEVKRYDFENGIAYKLKQIPEDLGSYGIKLDWSEYTNEKPIAYVKTVDENTLKFYWYGFYNNKTKKREMTECQFNQEQNISNEEIILKKCDE